MGATPSHIAAGAGYVWVTNADGDNVSRIDLAKREVVQTIPVHSQPSGIAFGNGAIWVANSLDGTVSRIDPSTNTVVDTVPVGNGPASLVSAAGSVWVANTGDGTITRIDAASGKPGKPLPIAAAELPSAPEPCQASRGPIASCASTQRAAPSCTITVGNGAGGPAFGDGAAWATNSVDGTVSRIDPITNSVTRTIAPGNGPAQRGRGRQRVGEQPIRARSRASICARSSRRSRSPSENGPSA